MDKKVLIDVQLLLELKAGILEAICSEDGLDGADGVYLLSGINLALGLPVEDQSPPPARKIVDALEIMNEFTMRPLDVEPFPYNDFWLKKLAVLCERCANLENAA